jgi:acetolactate synthase-1/2/3 large subunit
MTTCGELLVELLELCGIDTIFGIPGVHTVEFYRSLPKSKIRHITPRHEQGAGFMADGYARASGRPAACFVITGPGVTNIATAVAQAYADSVPMLVISSVNSTGDLGLGEGRLHELPSQQRLMEGLTAFSHTVRQPDELPKVLERAFAVFDSARPRPVHIELPLDVITSNADHVRRTIILNHNRPGPDPAKIAEAADLLRRARRPLVILGGGAQHAAVSALELVERLSALAVTTINGKGILPPDHPLSLGSTLPQPQVLEELRHADIVLAVGTELGETDTLLFDGRPKVEGKVIRIDIDSEQLTRNVGAEVAIVSDSDLALQALNRELNDFQRDRTEPVAQAQALRTQLQDLLTDPQHAHQRFMATVQQALPGVIIVGDSTQPIYSANLFYQPEQPRSYFNSSTGYGTLGYALPAALGAKLAKPERPVVALIGDGGLQFTIGELSTAVELALPLIILVWNNRGYNEIKKYMLQRGIPEIGVDIYTPDFIAIARGFGCRAFPAENLDQLQEQLLEAHHATGPTVIEIDESLALDWQ